MERLKMQVRDLQKVPLDSGQDVFVLKAIGGRGEKRFFAKLISRNAVCDLCHAIHFILIADEQGTIADLISVHITKYGNISLSSAEIIQLRKQLVGKSLLEPITYNPDVDAVSQATMSTRLFMTRCSGLDRIMMSFRARGIWVINSSGVSVLNVFLA